MAQAKLEGALQDNRYKGALTTLTLDRNEREAIKLSNDRQKTAQDIIESKQRVTKSQQEVRNLQETNNILKQTGVLRKLEAMQKSMGLDDDYTQTEWFIAQAAYDPKGGVEILNKYIQALGWIADQGVKQTGQTLKNTAKSIWNALTGN
jgi:ABC-type oligopeptide transport system substrate-binding subunit